jgi:hypothetical protein
MSRWPEPVREPIGPRLLTDADIDEALALTVRYLDEPEDPEFDPALHGFVTAARAVLIECSEVLMFEAQALRNELGLSERFRDGQIQQAITARKVARRVIDQLRHWLPEARG